MFLSNLKVSVQYKVVAENVYDAFYKLDYPQDQITSYVFDVVRAVVPKMKLDDVFEKKDEIANAVKGELNDAMTITVMTSSRRWLRILTPILR